MENNHENPDGQHVQEDQEELELTQEVSAEQKPVKEQRQDPAAKKMIGVVLIIYGIIMNISVGFMSLISGVGPEGLGLYMNRSMLMLLGGFEVYSGFLILKLAKNQDDEKMMKLCRNVGLMFLLVSASFVISTFMVRHMFIWITVVDVIFAIVYLSVQKKPEK